MTTTASTTTAMTMTTTPTTTPITTPILGYCDKTKMGTKFANNLDVCAELQPQPEPPFLPEHPNKAYPPRHGLRRPLTPTLTLLLLLALTLTLTLTLRYP